MALRICSIIQITGYWASVCYKLGKHQPHCLELRHLTQNIQETTFPDWLTVKPQTLKGKHGCCPYFENNLVTVVLV